MSRIDEYLLKRSNQFALTGTNEIVEDLQLTQSVISSTGVLSGTVTSGGQPLPGATIKVFTSSGIPYAHAKSGPQGQYTISEVIAGSYLVTATKTGYLTPVITSVNVAPNRPTIFDITLFPDPDASLNTLYGIIRQITPPAVIEGAIIDVFSVAGGVDTLVSITSSNSSGQYLAPYLPDGDYFVTVNKSGYFQSQSAVQTLSNASISPLDVSLIVNPNTNTGTINGLITSQTTLLPIPNATVALYKVIGGTETIINLTKTNTGGRYLFGNVAEGDYIVKSFAQTVTP